MLQSDYMMYKAVFSYMYNSAWIVNLYEGIATIPVLRILEAYSIAIVIYRNKTDLGQYTDNICLELYCSWQQFIPYMTLASYSYYLNLTIS